MDTPVEESNLAHIGSAEDAAARKNAAKTEVDWNVAGKGVGTQVWRVENTRDEFDNPNFGINPWPKKRYGEFYTGDSYIVLKTEREEDSDKLIYDIYFWIGAESSQDEYGVAAYKANELDDLLDDAPIQHREVQYNESDEFLKIFSSGIRYLDGGLESGFRSVDDSFNEISTPTRMYHIRRENRVTRCIQVAAERDSMNHGDAFILHAGGIVYTWFGDEASPFEKSKAAEMAHNMVSASYGKATQKLIEEVGDDCEEFWDEIGGEGDIKAADEYKADDTVDVVETKMYIFSNVDSVLKVEEVEVSKDNLISGDVCFLNTGKTIFVWIGKDSCHREQSQAMIFVKEFFHTMHVNGKTSIVRVKEGQESRVAGFKAAMK
jgi:gelsolin